MTQREKLIELLRETFEYTRGTCIDFDEAVEINADNLLANGVIVVDTNTVNIVNNIEPIQTAFGMPLDDLADLIRAKQDGRIIVPPCKVGDTVYVVSQGAGFSVVWNVYKATAKAIHLDRWGQLFIHVETDKENIGGYVEIERVFLTREEAEKAKVTCLNCKHLMFSDMYGECNKQLRIVNPSDTCEYAEPKERGEAE